MLKQEQRFQLSVSVRLRGDHSVTEKNTGVSIINDNNSQSGWNSGCNLKRV